MWISSLNQPRSAAAALLLAAISLSRGGADSDHPKRINLVLVTLDTTRADHLGCYGAQRARTPALDSLAARGVRYARALTAVPLTLPAHCSLMTGLDPPAHGVRDNGAAALPSDLPTLASVLADRGYATAAFLGSRVLDRRFGLARGFAVYDDRMAAEQIGEYGYPERDAQAVTRAATAWLAAQRQSRAPRPYFLWVHYYDPHAPYAPPPRWRGSTPEENYAGEIAYTDQQLGALLNALNPDLAATVVAVVGDHGEALGEHGERAHGIFLYRPVLEVPLIVSGPGVPRGQVISQVVATRRLASTLLRLLGLGEPAKGFGAPLAGLPVSEDNATQPIYSESWMPASAYGWAPLRAISDQRWRWIEAPRPELYDFVADPAESKNLWAERSEVVARMEQSLSRLENSIQSRQGSAPQLDPELAAALRSLGYFSGASAPPGAAAAGKTDPKDGIGMLQELESSKRALEGGNTKQALQNLELLVRRSPGNVPFLTQLARAQLATGQTGKAIATNQEAIARNPNLDFLHLHLAGAYRAGGQVAEARRAYQRALQLNPRLAAAWLGLAEMAFEQGRKEEERRLLQQAVEAGTDSAALLSRLAQLEIAESDYQAADLHLQRATSLDPLWAAAWLVWGDLGEKQNRPREALECYLQAIAADPTDGASLLRASRLLLQLDRKDQARRLLRQAATGAADPTAREQARLKLAQLDRDTSKP